MSEISYRKFNRNSDYLNQRKLFALSFPEAQRSILDLSHYQWKFESFPGPIASYQYSAADKNELVGFYGVLPFQYKIGDHIQTCGMVCDVMTHPEHRGKSIFTRIGRFATDDLKLKGLAFATGYPIRPEVIPGHLKVGWRIVQKMPMYLRLLGTKTLLPSPLQFLSSLLDPIIRSIQNLSLISIPSSYSVKNYLQEELLNLSEYEIFLSQWLTEQKNGLIKSKEFIKWRTSAPDSQYVFHTLWHKNLMVGMSISRLTILKGVEALAVLDFMVLQAHLKGALNLHKSLQRHALANKKDVVVCMSSSHWAKTYRFFRCLYIPTPAVFSLIIKKLNNSIPDSQLYESKQWHLFWLDSDDL